MFHDPPTLVIPQDLLSLAHTSLDVQGSPFRFRREASISSLENETNTFQYTQFEHKLLRPYAPRTPTVEKSGFHLGREDLVDHLKCAERDSMRAVLPGKPSARLQAVSTGCWEGRRLIVCLSTNTVWCLENNEANGK